MNHKHICIYTMPETLEHKKEPDMNCYWELRNTPKILQELEDKIDNDKWTDEDNYEMRLYFAIKGFIVGYFIINDWNITIYSCEINFDSNDWKEIKPIPSKSFQGFKYINEFN